MSRLIFDWPEHLKTRYNSNSFYKELRTENSDNIDSNNYSPNSLGMNTKPYIPHELGGIEIKPSAWNNGTIPIVTGTWEKAGADKLNNFPVIDPNGYNYTADSVKWLAFVMKNEYIPKGIECRLLPMARGKIPNIFSIDPADELPRDGFVVRYQIDNYLFQITDSLYDLQIAVRDLDQKKADLTAEEKQAFGIKVVQMLVNDSLLKLPDGSLRKQKIIPRTNYISGILNWMIEHNNAINVEYGQFSTSKPYDCFVNWYSDGNTTVIKLDKVYNLARDIRTLPAKYQSRFSSIALFHNDVLK